MLFYLADMKRQLQTSPKGKEDKIRIQLHLHLHLLGSRTLRYANFTREFSNL